MLDQFSILLTHGLLALTAWRLLSRADLNDDSSEPSPKRRKPWQREAAQDTQDG